MSVDATFGPLIMFGAGGTAVEVLRDTAHALPPLDLKLARDLMRQTRIWRLLQGYRDRPPADLDARSPRRWCGCSYLAVRHPEIREIDINPLLADDKGVIALDARVRVGDAARRSARRAWRSGPIRRNGQMERRVGAIGRGPHPPDPARGRGASTTTFFAKRDAGGPAHALLHRARPTCRTASWRG